MDPLDEQDLYLATNFSNFELLSAYPSLNSASLLGNNTELNILRLTVKLRFYDFYHHLWRARGGATNRNVGGSIPEEVISILHRLNTRISGCTVALG